eukprot:362740-Pyramimonas_sp.AAC.1
MRALSCPPGVGEAKRARIEPPPGLAPPGDGAGGAGSSGLPPPPEGPRRALEAGPPPASAAETSPPSPHDSYRPGQGPDREARGIVGQRIE